MVLLHTWQHREPTIKSRQKPENPLATRCSMLSRMRRNIPSVSNVNAPGAQAHAQFLREEVTGGCWRS